MSKFRKILKNIRGSEVVEKILMTVTAIIICGLGIAYMNKVMTTAIKDAGGDKLTNEQIVLPDNNTQEHKPIAHKEELIGEWVFKDNIDVKDVFGKAFSLDFLLKDGTAGHYIDFYNATETNAYMRFHLRGDNSTTREVAYENKAFASEKYKQITITNVNSLMMSDLFIEFMNKNAIKKMTK